MMMIETERMLLYPVSVEDLQTLIENELNQDMKKAYSEMLAGCEKMPEQHLWYTVWLMQLHDDNKQIVGDLCFKGLHGDGSVEIGYGVKPEYEGRGLATEAVTAMAKWAIHQPGVSRIEAEAEPDNIASQRVLQKSGFVPNGVLGEEGPRFVWENCYTREREDSMENVVIQMEHKMWETALHKDINGFKKLVSPDAVMICGGYRCLGNEYAGFITDFNISGYSISNMEVISSGDNEVTLHYVIQTQTEDAKAQDLAGIFHVVSIWSRKSDTWKLIFNMDSRIVES